MTKEWKPGIRWARQSLKAIDELIEMYKSDSKQYCPFCRLCLAYYDAKCQKCPWTIFAYKSCVGYTRQSYDERIKRLKLWKRRCKYIIKNTKPKEKNDQTRT